MKKTDHKLYLTAALLCVAILTVLFSAVYLVLKEPVPKEPEEGALKMEYRQAVAAAAEKYDVPMARIYAVIQTESSFRPTVVSKSGAVGLMQMMPATYEEQCAKRGQRYDPEDLKDPSVNIDYCTEYLRYLYDLTGSWDTAHLAYHAGIGTVRGWLKDKACSSDGVTVHTIPREQSKIYLERINAAYQAYDRALSAENNQ